MVAMNKLLEKIRSDVFIYLNVVQASVTVVGAFIMFIFMLRAAPGVISWWDIFWRGLVVALVGGAYSLAYNSRRIYRFFQLSRLGAQEVDPPAELLAEVREAANYMPRGFLWMTIYLWPLAILLLGLWLYFGGALTGEDSLRVVMAGWLFAPVQALILFYSMRHVMRRVGEWYIENGWPWFEENVSGYGIRLKLVASFVCLAAASCVAGVLITEVQREALQVEETMGRVCDCLEEIHAEAGDTLNPDSWDSARYTRRQLADLPDDTEFLISDRRAGILAGSLDTTARLHWYKLTKDSDEPEHCWWSPIPGERRFVAMQYFEQPGVWIAASCRPFPKAYPFWTRYGVTLMLVVIVFGVGSFMGYMAATDVGVPLKLLTDKASQAAEGRAVKAKGFLPGDELGGLSVSFNAVVESFHNELSKSTTIVDSIREVIAGLGGATAKIRAISDRQRGAIDEHTSLAEQAGEGAQEITMAADVIKERAHHTQYKMAETSASIDTAEGLIKDVLGVINGMMDDARVLFEEMQNLERNYRRMEEVMRIIEDIAERAEILSLNATLESGGRHHGGGARFGVVAGEVRRLSERITEQTRVIDKIFREVRKSSMEMAQAIEVGKVRAEDGPKRIKELADSLVSIDQRSTEASNSMNEIVTMAEDQAKALDQMKYMVAEIQSLAAVIDEVASGADQAVRTMQGHAENLGDLISAEKDNQEPET